MYKLLGLTLLFLGAAGAALANSIAVPEIDPGSAGSALAVLAGCALMIKSRRS